MPVVPDLPGGAPSGWVPDMTCCAAWDDYSAEVKARALTIGAGLLWMLTGRQYGYRTLVARPCNPPPLPPLYQTYPVNVINPWGFDAGSYYPLYIVNGEWHNVGCGGLMCCGTACEVVLQGPVASVDSVTVGVDTIDPSAYRIDNSRLLVRQDGDCWPKCQDFGKPAGEDDTFVVTYQWGYPVPAIANAVLGDLVCELAKACAGRGCVLPARIQSISRQGGTVNFDVPGGSAGEDLAYRGLTNIASVDQVIAALNPHLLQEPTSVSSPDVPPTRYTTWP